MKTVDTVTLESFLEREGIERCDVLKIDIEGREYEAIMASRGVFARGDVRVVILQMHHGLLHERGRDPQDISNLLSDCGYSVDPRFQEAPTVWVWSP